MSAEYLLLCQGVKNAKLHLELVASDSAYRDPALSSNGTWRRVTKLRVSGAKGEVAGEMVDGLSDLGRAAERLRGRLKL